MEVQLVLLLGIGVLVFDEVLSSCNEVIKHILFALKYPSFVPAVTILSVCDCVMGGSYIIIIAETSKCNSQLPKCQLLE